MKHALLVVIAAVLAFCGGVVFAQNAEGRAQRDAKVISGSDVGVRLVSSRTQDGRLQGTIVVKQNGQWVEVVPAPSVIGAAGSR